MEQFATARSGASNGARSAAQGSGPAGGALRESGTGRRAAGSAGRGGQSATALRVEETGPAARARTRAIFFFDLACPFSYIAAERIERLLGDVEWVPTPGQVLDDRREWADNSAVLEQVEGLARAVRLPLVWPERFPVPVPRAMRAAAYASEIGSGARFALAASRLAFCGGFDLEKSSVLTDAAAAAAIPIKECLAAADEEWRDEELHATAAALKSEGVNQVPAVGMGDRWFDGIRSLSDAAAWLRRS
ncbi:MAG: DsbA family protein [Solirubrobacteraceae bacterium]